MIGDIHQGPVIDRFPDLDDIPEASALGVRLTVVSAATERGLVRGIGHFTPHSQILAEVRRAVGVLEEVADWAKATYHLPSYMGDGWDIGGGIFLYRWDLNSTEDWRDPKRRHPHPEGKLLYLPTGWVNHDVNPRRS